MSDVLVVALTLVAGVLTGVLSGMFGVGGAVASTPVIRLLGATPLAAVGSTLPSILPSALSGTMRYRREGLISLRITAWTAGAGVLASVAGALLSSVVPGDGHPLMLMTAGLVGFSAYRLGRADQASPPGELPADLQAELRAEGETDAGPGAISTKATARPDSVRQDDWLRQDEWWRLVLIGIGAGLLSGLLGVGGGLLMVPAFTGWVRLPIKEALGTSLACVGVLAIPGTITHALLGNIDWLYAIPLCFGVVPGAQLGSHLAIRSSDRALRLWVGVILGALATIYATGEIIALAT